MAVVLHVLLISHADVISLVVQIIVAAVHLASMMTLDFAAKSVLASHLAAAAVAPRTATPVETRPPHVVVAVALRTPATSAPELLAHAASATSSEAAASTSVASKGRAAKIIVWLVEATSTALRPAALVLVAVTHSAAQISSVMGLAALLLLLLRLLLLLQSLLTSLVGDLNLILEVAQQVHLLVYFFVELLCLSLQVLVLRHYLHLLLQRLQGLLARLQQGLRLVAMEYQLLNLLIQVRELLGLVAAVEVVPRSAWRSWRVKITVLLRVTTLTVVAVGRLTVERLVAVVLASVALEVVTSRALVAPPSTVVLSHLAVVPVHVAAAVLTVALISSEIVVASTASLEKLLSVKPVVGPPEVALVSALVKGRR